MENTYINISDIPGESMERNHKEWIPVKTISWEVTRTLDMDDLGTTQRGYANSSFGKVSVSTELSKASPKLMLSVADGTVRKLYAESKGRNAIHASDSDENAAIEIGFFFSSHERLGL